MIMKCPARPGGAGRPRQDHVIVTKQDQHEVAAGAMLGTGPGKVLLAELCALIAPVFAQARSRFAAFAYVAALLAAPGTASRAGSWASRPGTPRRGGCRRR